MAETIGRADELAALAGLLAPADSGEPVTAVVEGTAGAGKTALLERFAADHRLRCLRACGAPWETDRAYGVIEQLTGQQAPSDPDGPDGPVAAGDRLLAAAGAEALCLVAVDDAQHADEPSLQAMLSALRRTSGQRLLVVLAVATDSETTDSATLRRFRETAHRLVPLAPLSATELAELAHRFGTALPGPLSRLLAAHTGGNPRYAKQLLHELPAETWTQWQPRLPAPAAFATVVRQRLQRCGEARPLVEAAAVLDEDCSFQDAACLAQCAEPINALDLAQRHGLLESRRMRGLTVLRTPNPMTRAAVLDAIGPYRRTELHRMAANTVADPGAALRHRVHATPFPDDELAGELVRFADARAETGAWRDVGDALIKASRLTTDRALRRQRLLRGVDATFGAGQVLHGAAFVPEIESFPESPLRNTVLAYPAIVRGRPGDAETWLDRAWERCDPHDDPETAAVICQRRVLHALGRCQAHELVRWADRALELAPDSTAAVESLAIRGLGVAGTGSPEAGRAHYAEVTERIRAGAQAQRVRMGKGWLDFVLDDPHTARTELESAVPTGFLMGSWRISLWAQAWLARTQFVEGYWNEALETVNKAGAEIESTGLALIQPLVHWTGVQIHALRGEWERADEHLRFATAAAHDYEIMVLPAAIARAQYAEARADYDGVVRALAPLLVLRERCEIDEPGFWPWPDIYANALVMTNKPEAADAFLAPYEQLAAERGHRSSMARLGYARGRIDGARGELDIARRRFDAALGCLDGLPLPYDTARVNFAYGQTLRRAGKRREADSVLHTARDIYAHLGAASYVRRCDRELQAGGVHSARAAGSAELTAQEHAVAALVARGMTNKEAAGELFVSVKTVQFHLTRIYAKLGIRTRGELAAGYQHVTD